MNLDLPVDTSDRILRITTNLVAADMRAKGQAGAPKASDVLRKLPRGKDLHELIWGIELLCAHTHVTKFRYVNRDEAIDEDVEAVQVLKTSEQAFGGAPYRMFDGRPFSAFPVWLQEAIGAETVTQVRAMHRGVPCWDVKRVYRSRAEPGDWIVRLADGRINVVSGGDTATMLHPCRPAPQVEQEPLLPDLRSKIAYLFYARSFASLGAAALPFASTKGVWWSDADRVLGVIAEDVDAGTGEISGTALACLCEAAAPGWVFIDDVTGDPEHSQEPADDTEYRHGFVSLGEQMSGVRSTAPDGPGDVRIVKMCRQDHVRSFGISTRNKSVVWASKLFKETY